MTGVIGLYSDLISPFGYLGARGIREIAARHGRVVEWRPILLGISVMKVMGLPPVPDTPLKGPYSANDIDRCFRLEKLPYNPPEDRAMAPLPPGRAMAWVLRQDASRALDFAIAIGEKHWSRGQNMSAPEAVAKTAGELGFDAAQALAAIDSEAAKADLRAHVEAALARGVFGAPTFDIDGELFWGHDRLAMVDEWLRRGGW